MNNHFILFYLFNLVLPIANICGGKTPKDFPLYFSITSVE